MRNRHHTNKQVELIDVKQAISSLTFLLITADFLKSTFSKNVSSV